jgi:hypothetical protein
MKLEDKKLQKMCALVTTMKKLLKTANALKEKAKMGNVFF